MNVPYSRIPARRRETPAPFGYSNLSRRNRLLNFLQPPRNQMPPLLQSPRRRTLIPPQSHCRRMPLLLQSPSPVAAAPSIQKEVLPTEFRPVFPAERDAAPLSRTEFSPKPPTGFSQPRAGETSGPSNPLPPKREAFGGDNLRQLLLQRARPLARNVVMTKRLPTSPDKASEVRRISHQQDALKSDSPIPTAPESRKPPPRPSDDPASQQNAIDQRLVILGAARNAVRAGRADEAIGRFEEYLAAAPDDLEVHEEYAGVLGQMKQFAKATAELENILKRQPERAPRLRTEIGNMYVQAKAFDNAVEQFSMALAALPNTQNAGVKLQRLDIATQLARAMGFAGDVDGSARTFARYLSEVGPGDPDAPRFSVRFSLILIVLKRPSHISKCNGRAISPTSRCSPTSFDRWRRPTRRTWPLKRLTRCLRRDAARPTDCCSSGRCSPKAARRRWRKGRSCEPSNSCRTVSMGDSVWRR